MEAQRLCPVYDKHRGPSEGAKRLQYLRWLAEDLEYPPKGRALPPNYDRQCWDVALQLRDQGAYLISTGVH